MVSIQVIHFTLHTQINYEVKINNQVITQSLKVQFHLLRFQSMMSSQFIYLILDSN